MKFKAKINISTSIDQINSRDQSPRNTSLPNLSVFPEHNNRSSCHSADVILFDPLLDHSTYPYSITVYATYLYFELDTCLSLFLYRVVEEDNHIPTLGIRNRHPNSLS